MKKFLTTAIILSMLAVAMTGCGGNKDNSSDAESNVSSDVESNVSSDVESEVSSDTESEVSSDAESTPSEESDVTSEESGATVNGRAATMAAAAQGAIEWPAMMEFTDAEEINTIFSIDPTLCEDYFFSMQMMSEHLNEIVIVKPTAGNEDAVKEQVDARFAYLKDGAAFYPEQEESAAGGVSGVTEDGYYYIVIHKDGETAAQALLSAE